jgi:hypothetical protein
LICPLCCSFQSIGLEMKVICWMTLAWISENIIHQVTFFLLWKNLLVICTKTTVSEVLKSFPFFFCSNHIFTRLWFFLRSFKNTDVVWNLHLIWYNLLSNIVSLSSFNLCVCVCVYVWFWSLNSGLCAC